MSVTSAAVLRIQVIADTARAQASMRNAAGSVSSSTARIKSTLASVGGAIAGAFAAEKVVSFVRDSVAAASDLNETMNKVSQLFGTAGDSIIAWSKTSATSLGLSQTAALDAASTFGIFGKSAGLTGQDLTSFSTNLVGLSADFASFANTTPQEAVEAMGAALRGETEPIRKYGLMLNDATIKQEAVRQGLIKTTKDAINPAKRALAVNGLIQAFANSNKITGDFQRTSGGLANKQRILAAQMENLKATVGQALLPAMLGLVSAGQKTIQFFGTLAGWVRRNGSTLITLGVALAIVTVAINAQSIAIGAYLAFTRVVTVATRAWAIVQGVLNAVMSANPITIVIVAIVALVAAIVIAYQRSETFRAIVQAAFNAVKVAVVAVGQAFVVAFRAVVSAVSTAAAFVRRIIGTVVNFLLHSPIAAAILGPWRIAIGALRALVSGGVSGVIAYFRGLVTGIGRTLARVGSVITTPFRSAWGWINTHVVSPIKNGFSGVASAISRALSGVTSAITAPFQAAWNWINSHVIGPIKRAWNGVAGALNGVGFSLKVPTNAVTKFLKIAGKGFEWHMPRLPTLAAGGVVDRATLALIGEGRSPEIVAPVPLLRQIIREEAGTGGNTFVINGALDAEAVARQIRRILAESDRRRGGVVMTAGTR